MLWDTFRAALIDLDGVLTPTADLHMRAWRQVFTARFAAHQITREYSDTDYFAHVDGRRRDDGIRATLASRGVRLPEGSPSDPPDADTVRGIGNAKNALFNRLLDEGGLDPYPGAIALLDHLAAQGVAVAVVSGSRNARRVLAAAGLADRCPVLVDGEVADAVGLAGKPDPDTFAYAAAELGVPAERAVVVEDAISGVQAGRAGGFGIVVGVDRGAGVAQLRAAGADVVVHDLAELVT